MYSFPRLFSLDLDQDCLIANRWVDKKGSWQWRHAVLRGASCSQLFDLERLLSTVHLRNSHDYWIWNIGGDLRFSVRQVRWTIDAHILPTGLFETLWNKFVLWKVNIFFWRCRLDRLPTGSNLDSRGIDVPSTLCPICDSHVETIDHIIIACPVALDVWAFVYRWCDLTPPTIHSIPDLVHWMEHVHLTGSQRSILQVIVLTTSWSLWRAAMTKPCS
ncbi:RNA-directed DNA polymerase, eukaryota [Tanacetum coccineum]